MVEVWPIKERDFEHVTQRFCISTFYTNVVNLESYSSSKYSAKFSLVSPSIAKYSLRGDFPFSFWENQNVFGAIVEKKIDDRGRSDLLCVWFVNSHGCSNQEILNCLATAEQCWGSWYLSQGPLVSGLLEMCFLWLLSKVCNFIVIPGVKQPLPFKGLTSETGR